MIASTFGSNAIKFTHEGKVGIRLYVVSDPSLEEGERCPQKLNADQSTVSENGLKEDADQEGFHVDGPYQNHSPNDEPGTPAKSEVSMDADQEEEPQTTTVWLRCDVYDTGIGIPGNALNDSLYMKSISLFLIVFFCFFMFQKMLYLLCLKDTCKSVLIMLENTEARD